MKRNLVYYSVGLKDVYSDMVKLSISSIDKSNKEPIDIVIITDQECYVRNFEKYQRANIDYHIVEKINTPDEVCFNKTKIFGYQNINDYENILYLDGDTLVNYDLSKMFEKCKKDDRLYGVVEDYSIENHRRIHFSLGTYTQEDIDFFREKLIYTFNCGVFLFKNSYLMKKHFNNVYQIMVNHQGDFFADQSFMNYYFNTLNLINTTKIKKDVDCVYVVEENINYITDFYQKIYHFLGGTYFGENKINKMKEFNTRL